MTDTIIDPITDKTIDKYLNTISKNPLINKDKIIQTVEHYIKNYKSNEYQDYKTGRMTNKLYPKIGRKNHMVKEEGKIKLVDTKTEKVIVIINEPEYINISAKLIELEKSKNILTRELDMEYNELKTNKKYLSPDRVKEFKLMRNEYIQILENIEVYKLYRLMINEIIMDGESIAYSTTSQYFNESNPLFEKQTYKIPEEIISEYMTIQGNKLNKFNELITSMHNNKINKKDIKKYIEETDKSLNNYNKKMQKYLVNNDKYIDYIVVKLPSIKIIT